MIQIKLEIYKKCPIVKLKKNQKSELLYLYVDTGTMNQKETQTELAPKPDIKMRLEYTPLRLDPLYIKVACWTYLAIMYVVPFLALLILNLRYV